VNAQQASKDISRLFEAAVIYYTASEGYSVILECELKHSLDLRAQLNTFGTDISAAWFEGFDAGTRGTVRALMQSHLGLMDNIYDRLRAMLLSMQDEDFADSHVRLMDRIRGSARNVAICTRSLLCYITEAACDGSFTEAEKQEIRSMIAQSKDAVRELARDFDMSRRLLNQPINTNLLGECFFVVSLSAYARLVWEFGEMMLTKPPKGTSFGQVFVDNIKGTWNWAALTDPVNMNFTTKHFIAIILCWFYSVYVDEFSGACVVTSVFLMNGNLCPDIQALLNVMNAVILAFLTGSMMFKFACWTGPTASLYVLPLITSLMWLGGLYCLFSKSALALAALFIVALTPFKLINICPQAGIDMAAAAAGEMFVIKANVLAILFVSSVQYLLAYDRPSMIATDSVDSAFKDLKSAFKCFWESKHIDDAIAGVKPAIDAGAGYNASARIEPRLFRYPWKGDYYDEILAQLRQIRLDILIMSMAMGGSDGQPDSIFDKISHVPEFASVRDDLNQTIEDAHTLVLGLLSCESSSYDGLKFVKDLDTIDKLDALPALIDHLARGGIGFPMQKPDTLEDDELCQMSTVFLSLDNSVKHIAGLIKTTVQYS